MTPRLKHRTVVAMVLVVCLTHSQLSYGDEVTRGWLDRMGQAVQSLSYQGQFVHRDRGRSQSMGVVHRVDDGGSVSERLWSLDGPTREFIRRDNELICILSDNQEVVVEQVSEDGAALFDVPDYSTGLDSLYQLVTHEEEDRIADRVTQVIDILPRDRYRYGYRLWLDVETAMPLRSDLIDEDKNTLETTHFISISYRDDIKDSELDQATKADGYSHYVNSTPDGHGEINPIVNWAAAELPRGFYLSRASLDSSNDGDGEIAHLVYTDGLATVSVFVEPVNHNDILHGMSDDMSVFGKSAVGGDTTFQVIVMGEVPRNTLQLIGESVKFVN